MCPVHEMVLLAYKLIYPAHEMVLLIHKIIY
jgi:hypothetical protein